MGDTDSSEAQGSSGGITPAILEQLADFQRRVVLLEGATPGAEIEDHNKFRPEMENGNTLRPNMGGDEMRIGQHAHDTAEEATRPGITSTWMRRHLSDSIYIWACGEKADKEDGDVTLSDRFIGWFILFIQAVAYGMLAFLAKGQNHPTSDLQISALLPPLIGAMYLLVASTIHDLRAGYSLLVDGTSTGHRAFGFSLLVVYGLMVYATMTVLMSTSENNASVVLNAVAVLFVADLDEKALKFLLSVPHQWRNFWAIEPAMISFALALVAIIHTWSPSRHEEDEAIDRMKVGSWFVWALHPGMVTMVAYRLSVCLQGFLGSCGKAFETVDRLTVSCIGEKALAGFSETIKHAKKSLLEGWGFYAALCVWLVCGVLSWTLLPLGIPVAFDFSDDNRSVELEFTRNIVVLVGYNAVGVAGLAMKGTILLRNERVVSIQEPLRSSEANSVRGNYGCWNKSHVPSLLLGWGIGYWASSLMLILILAWDKTVWDNAPIAVEIIGYVVVPLFAFASFFMVADANFLGVKFRGFIHPVVELLQDRRGVVYWTMATVLRDAFVIWARAAYVLIVVVFLV